MVRESGAVLVDKLLECTSGTSTLMEGGKLPPKAEGFGESYCVRSGQDEEEDNLNNQASNNRQTYDPRRVP